MKKPEKKAFSLKPSLSRGASCGAVMRCWVRERGGSPASKPLVAWWFRAFAILGYGARNGGDLILDWLKGKMKRSSSPMESDFSLRSPQVTPARFRRQLAFGRFTAIGQRFLGGSESTSCREVDLALALSRTEVENLGAGWTSKTKQDGKKQDKQV